MTLDGGNRLEAAAGQTQLRLAKPAAQLWIQGQCELPGFQQYALPNRIVGSVVIRIEDSRKRGDGRVELLGMSVCHRSPVIDRRPHLRPELENQVQQSVGLVELVACRFDAEEQLRDSL